MFLNFMFVKVLCSGVLLASGALVLAGRHVAPHDGCPGVGPLSTLVSTSASAQQDKPALSGTWNKKDAQLLIEFAGKDTVKFLPHGDGDGKPLIVIVCEYTLEKNGLVKAKVTGHEGSDEVKKKVEAHAPIGLKFGFTWTPSGDAAKLEEVTGKGTDTLKSHLEGEFEKKK